MSHRWACVLGHPVAHSLSPLLHNSVFSELGMDIHYEARDVAPEDLPQAIALLRQVDCLGANVTAPHKQASVALVDAVSDEVRALGALNTIVNHAGRLVGANTDARGLAQWMRQAGVHVANRPALVLGAGGATPSTVWALADVGASQVRILNRTVARAQDVVTTLRRMLPDLDLSWGSLAEAAEPPAVAWGVIINATSLGHQGGAPVVHPDCYSPGCVAIELAYNPPVTDFMIAARQAGARAENGSGMLLHQAALAFEHWTGQAPPLDLYTAAMTQRVAP